MDHITTLLETLHQLTFSFLLLACTPLNNLRDFSQFYVPARSLRSSTAFPLNASSKSASVDCLLFLYIYKLPLPLDIRMVHSCIYLKVKDVYFKLVSDL